MPYFAYGVNSRSPRRSPHRSPPAHVPLWTLGHRTPSGSLDTQTGHPLGSVLYIYFYYYTKQTGWVSCPMSTVYPCPPLSTPVQCPPYTDCPPCLDSPSVHLDSDVHVSTLSTWGVLSTLGAEPLPNRGILHPPGVQRLHTKSSFIQRRGRGAGGAADLRDRTIALEALNLRPDSQARPCGA